jgi:DNA-binding transcriptional LysR family regulator
MDRDILTHLPIVLAVARQGGFAAAAGELGLGTSAVSHAVKTVERRLGLQLFTRTTRSVALTEAGRAFVEAAEPALDGLSDSLDRLRADHGRVGGLLRLNGPRFALALCVTPVLTELRRQYPDLRVEVFSDDGASDIVAAGFDAGVRLGELIDQDMVAVRLTPPLHTAMVASPAYLDAAGVPQSIEDLHNHACITFRKTIRGGLYRWTLRERNRQIAFNTSYAAITSDPLYARDLALAGVGIAYLLREVLAEELADSRLVEVLPGCGIQKSGLFLFFPRRPEQPAKLRAFVDTARAMLRRK